MRNTEDNKTVTCKTRPIDYLSIGLSMITAIGTVYIILDNAGVFKKKKKKENEEKS